ncbi:hypothetical protein Bca4012_033493 [Brassica carinata]
MGDPNPSGPMVENRDTMVTEDGEGTGSKRIDHVPQGSTVVDRDRQGSLDEKDLPIKSGPRVGTWVNAVQGKKVLKKYEMDIQMKDGVGSVTVPDEIFKDAAPLWEDFLIGRFLEKAPHIAKVHAIVNKIWALGDKSQMIDVYEINSTTMKFKVSNPITRNRIIRRAMWNIAEIPVVMAKWSPLTEDIKQETHSIPLWVHLRNVPMDMYSWKGLSFTSSPVGEPVRLHPETEQCINLKVAKVFVKADLSKELPKSMNFTLKGKETLVEYSYPWLPPKCTTCGRWGHLAKVCRGKNVDVDIMENTVEMDDNKKTNGSIEARKLSGKGIQTEEDSLNGKILVTKEDVNETVGSVVSGSLVEDTEGKEKNTAKVNTKEEKVWKEVSPGKASRTPVKNTQLEFGQVSILSKSRFSVLSEEEGEMLEEKEEDNEATKEEENIMEEEKQDEMEELISQKEEDMINVRQYLPRGSKSKHKFLSEVSVHRARGDDPGEVNKKKKSRKNQ